MSRHTNIFLLALMIGFCLACSSSDLNAREKSSSEEPNTKKRANNTDWPQFRGSGGTGASDAIGLPSEWDTTTNIVWKTKLPGRGASSPVVIGDRIYVTSYSGYGVDEDHPGDEADLKRQVSCYRLSDGGQVWELPSKPNLPETPYQGFQALHGYASSTPASDGENLFVFYGKSGVAGLSLDGKLLWTQNIGTETHNWGSGTSPLLHGDLVIVNASVESKSVVALNKTTGEEVWSVGGMDMSWSTPALIEVPDGSTELVVSIKKKILGLDPATGDQLWECVGLGDYTCPAVLGVEGVAYVIGGRKNTTIAVRGGGRGDVTESHRLWETSRGSNVSSPVFHDGHLYWASEARGIVYCADAKTGDLVYQERLNPRPGKIYASPLLADGKVYYIGRESGVFILAAKPEFEIVAHIEPLDASIHNASFVVGGGNLLLRTDEYLYLIGQ